MPCDIGPLQRISSEILGMSAVVSSRIHRTSTYVSPNLLLGQRLTQRLKGKAYLPGYHEIICLFASNPFSTLVHRDPFKGSSDHGIQMLKTLL